MITFSYKGRKYFHRQGSHDNKQLKHTFFLRSQAPRSSATVYPLVLVKEKCKHLVTQQHSEYKFTWKGLPCTPQNVPAI